MPSYLYVLPGGGDPLWLADGRADDGRPRYLGNGPLDRVPIMVVTFVGFVGGYSEAVLGVDDVLLGGIAAACLVTWFTFLPSLYLYSRRRAVY